LFRSGFPESWTRDTHYHKLQSVPVQLLLTHWHLTNFLPAPRLPGFSQSRCKYPHYLSIRLVLPRSALNGCENSHIVLKDGSLPVATPSMSIVSGACGVMLPLALDLLLLSHRKVNLFLFPCQSTWIDASFVSVS
jgi:hypothetical protein